ncbi:hypothetical protein L873DRAFT_1225400 [Choiromyces venosus 120613-1]|uniref:Uncharacterized protein n=1 Tax=Choiromyces venosus 120613-1 TaxID=1336337 RepID=A0A3N4JDU6_9PEZI|nr:hypothetical protein L873DRAFT_1225400 [Choiromyces venosus 120613-1]
MDGGVFFFCFFCTTILGNNFTVDCNIIVNTRLSRSFFFFFFFIFKIFLFGLVSVFSRIPFPRLLLLSCHNLW